MTTTLKLDSRARINLAKVGARPGQTYAVRLDGARIVLEPVGTKPSERKKRKPNLA